MSRIFEIFYDDLTPEAQKELDALAGEHNYDVFPLAIIDFSEEDND